MKDAGANRLIWLVYRDALLEHTPRYAHGSRTWMVVFDRSMPPIWLKYAGRSTCSIHVVWPLVFGIKVPL